MTSIEGAMYRPRIIITAEQHNPAYRPYPFELQCLTGDGHELAAYSLNVVQLRTLITQLQQALDFWETPTERTFEVTL